MCTMACVHSHTHTNNNNNNITVVIHEKETFAFVEQMKQKSFQAHLLSLNNKWIKRHWLRMSALFIIVAILCPSLVAKVDYELLFLMTLFLESWDYWYVPQCLNCTVLEIELRDLYIPSAQWVHFLDVITNEPLAERVKTVYPGP